MFTALLEMRASFALSSLILTWIVIGLLALCVLGLQAKVTRLERGRGTSEAAPRSHLLGSSLAERLAGLAPEARVVLFLSGTCHSCLRLLDGLSAVRRPSETVIAWIGPRPAALESLPAGIVLIEDGERWRDALGITVMPYALVLDEEQRVVRALPIHSLELLSELHAPEHRTRAS